MVKGNKIKKVFKTNVDTVSLNVEQVTADSGLFPYAEGWDGKEDNWWQAAIDPRRLRKKGTQICK